MGQEVYEEQEENEESSEYEERSCMRRRKSMRSMIRIGPGEAGGVGGAKEHWGRMRNRNNRSKVG